MSAAWLIYFIFQYYCVALGFPAVLVSVWEFVVTWTLFSLSVIVGRCLWRVTSAVESLRCLDIFRSSVPLLRCSKHWTLIN